MDEIMNDFIGTNCNPSNFIVGPCSIESYNQIRESASHVKTLGYKYLRGGAYKPRTTSNSFQGLGITGIKYLYEVSCEDKGL